MKKQRNMWKAAAARRKGMAASLLALVLFVALSGAASAHVVVYPKEATQGSYEKFTVRVPTEKDAATVQIKVNIPDEVNISRFAPMYGWSYEVERNADDKIVSVTWKAENGGLTQTEFGEFNMQGKIANEAEELVWKAVQTYEDGTVVQWVGEPGADKPASVTQVRAATGADDHQAGADTAADDEAEGMSWLQIVTAAIALAALVLSVMALRASRADKSR